jgi:hypothetical protein
MEHKTFIINNKYDNNDILLLALGHIYNNYVVVLVPAVTYDWRAHEFGKFWLYHMGDRCIHVWDLANNVW